MRKLTIPRLLAGLLSATLIAVGSGVTPAAEASPVTGSHCVITAVPVVNGVAVISETPSLSCFATYAEATTFATVGNDTIIAENQDTDWVNETLQVRAKDDTDGCTDGDEFRVPNLKDDRWNDKIDSAETFAACEGMYYEHADYNPGDDGATQRCTCATMDAMEDETTSMHFYKPSTPDADVAFRGGLLTPSHGN